jgi:CheY-like chemotaxis protein
LDYNTPGKQVKKLLNMKTEPHNNSSILIVDDVEFNIILLEFMIKDAFGESKKILKAESAEEAFKVIDENPDIKQILMDVNMPGMDGISAASKIIKDHPDIQIIIQTAFASDKNKQDAAVAGCVSFLTKPIDKDELIGILKNTADQY